jgi:GNAT superfamily N-acetyltransferase
VSPLRLRPARTDDAGALSDLAISSKAAWGYDEAFIEACRTELTITPRRIAAERIVVAEDGDAVVGFSSLVIEGGTADLVDLFVDSGRLRRGIGSLLFDDALAAARAGGAVRVQIEADPHAEAFYERRGARRIGLAPSGSIPGRMLPLLEVDLAGEDERPGCEIG